MCDVQSLLLLAHLIKNGSERVVTSAREHLYDLRSLESYHCVGKLSFSPVLADEQDLQICFLNLCGKNTTLVCTMMHVAPWVMCTFVTTTLTLNDIQRFLREIYCHQVSIFSSRKAVLVSANSLMCA